MKRSERQTRRAELPSRFYGIRVGPIMSFPDVIAAHGGDPAVVMAKAGLAADTFADGNNRISIDDVGRLCQSSALEADCPDAMLLAGMRCHCGLLGELGALMNNSPTVGDALRNLTMHMHLHDRVAVPLLFTTAPGRIALGYSLLGSNTVASDKILEATHAILYCLVRELCGRGWKALAVQFAHAKPRNVKPLRDAFDCPLHFDAEFSAVIFSMQWLERPIAGADPALYRLLQEKLATSELASDRDVAEKVRGALQSMVLSGTTSSDAVASLLGISERTLRRRLAADGTTFQRLLNETLLTLAKQLMTETALSVSDISAALRYRSVPTFSSAFKRWTGSSPAQWRSAQAQSLEQDARR